MKARTCNAITYEQFAKEMKGYAREVGRSKSDLFYFAYRGDITVKWDSTGCYGDVYIRDELLHDGCDLQQSKRYLKTQ